MADVIDQLRVYLDYAGTSATEALVTDRPSTPVRWYRRGPVLAGIAAMVVLLLAVPAVLIGPDAGPAVDEPLPDPLDVGMEVVWPAGGFRGDADAIAAEFARVALGWPDVATVSDRDAAADGPIWTTIQHRGKQDLEVLSIPIGEGRRALVQVGSPGVTNGPGQDGEGQYVGFPRVPGATSVVLHIRYFYSDRVEVLRADQDEIDRGRVNVTSDTPVAGMVVVYLDENGDAVTARGGHFGQLGPAPIDVPGSHAAHRLAADGYPSDRSPVHGALCAQSGWQICLVQENGILAVVAFGNPDNTAITLEGSALPYGPITLPLPGDTVVGIESPGGSITGTVLVDGEWAGELNGMVNEADAPGLPVLTLEAGLSSLSPPFYALAVNDAKVVVGGTVTAGSSVHITVTSQSDGSVVSEVETTATDDSFEQQVEVAPGANTVTITARLGNQVATLSLGTRYEPNATVEFAFLRQVSETEIVADVAQTLIDPQLLTLPLADDVAVWLATSAPGPVSFVQVEMAEWLALFNAGAPWSEEEEPPSPEPPHFGFFRAAYETTPYWLVILDGEVIAVEQQYRP